jgi:hypothetical protein
MSFTMRARWEFVVGSDEKGDVLTRWSVVSDEGDGLTTESDHGTAQGPLHVALFEAYDRMGVVCPFVLDHDLLHWGGHREEEA